MKYKYITIEREYGSGAREIGRRLSEQTGIPCYGTEILEEAAKRMQMTPAQALELEEKSVGSLLYTIEMLGRSISGSVQHAPETVQLYTVEQQIIRELAAQGTGIFIGRCAGHALRDMRDVLRVYIHAEPNMRRDRVIHEYGIPESEADQVIRDINRRRENYYFANTGHKWTEFRQYNLVLDSSELGLQNCVDLIQAVAYKD